MRVCAASQKRAPQLPVWWGGYLVEFKLAERTFYEKVGHDIEALRRQSELVGPQQKRTFTIDISSHEFCEGKVQREIEDYAVYVYSLEMIAIEKLRAICQQMPAYTLGNRSPRARDFYDIHRIITNNNIALLADNNLSVLRSIFSSKQVPLELLAEIGVYREFHRPDWPAVDVSISGPHHNFDIYFDFVTSLALTIHEALQDNKSATPPSTVTLRP